MTPLKGLKLLIQGTDSPFRVLALLNSRQRLINKAIDDRLSQDGAQTPQLVSKRNQAIIDVLDDLLMPKYRGWHQFCEQHAKNIAGFTEASDNCVITRWYNAARAKSKRRYSLPLPTGISKCTQSLINLAVFFARENINIYQAFGLSPEADAQEIDRACRWHIGRVSNDRLQYTHPT